jgi:hypothetical protein
MPDYRRNRVPGGTYFFTANLLNRASDLLVARIDLGAWHTPRSACKSLFASFSSEKEESLAFLPQPSRLRAVRRRGGSRRLAG